jgi:hypothetical protein
LERVSAFNWSFLKVLREIGNERLKNLIKSTSLSDKDKLCNYVDDILEFITDREDIYGSKDYYFDDSNFENTDNSVLRAKKLMLDFKLF